MIVIPAKLFFTTFSKIQFILSVFNYSDVLRLTNGAACLRILSCFENITNTIDIDLTDCHPSLYVNQLCS